MYNSSVLSLYAPDTFPVADKYKSSHDEMIRIGKTHIKNKTVVITSLLRDVGHKMREIIKRAESIGEMFNNYVVLIVENDSKDDTRTKLLEWTKKNSRVKILGCGYNASTCSLKFPKTEGHGVDRPRIQKMVNLRNIYLEEVQKNYSNWDYLIMWDLDAIASVYKDGVENSMGYFATQPNISSICANGMYRWGFLTLFYDTYALLDEDGFHINNKLMHDVKKGLMFKYDRGHPPVKVQSCFSGFAIYRISSIIGDIRYDMSTDDNLECEHVRLNRKIKGDIVVNPSMINFLLLND